MNFNAAMTEDVQPLTILGLETSCDETAAAVVTRGPDGRGTIDANVVRAQWEEHRPFAGVVPEIAARAHVTCLDEIVAQALAQAGRTLGTIDAVAATTGPGLVGGLLVGAVTAKALAYAAPCPFMGVNHLEAHALTVGLTDAVDPPYLLLLVSGGHTQLVAVDGFQRYRRLGTTIDDALGEAFDKTAKLLGLGFPGGPDVERWAARGDPSRFALPRPMKGREAPHFSFAGLKTALLHQARALAPLQDGDVADLCAGFEAAVCEAVCDRVATAMALEEASAGAQAANNARTLCVAGGVAANRRLAAALQALCDARGYRLVVPPAALCTDNAAMVAWAGAAHIHAGHTSGYDAPVRPRWPLDPQAPVAKGAGVKP
ncbi:MAG: tRNA (adenosine(37)-N6)-threonylcarbamoyltransferase complex transferase subunit TsaD [Pseudomonadota bacterium]